MKKPWLLIVGGGAVLGGLVAKLLSGEEASPDDVTAPPPDPNAPNFPTLPIGSGLYLALDAANAFIAMRQAASAVGIALPVSTAWRSRDWQQRLYDAYQAFLAGVGPWAPQAAKPGSSKHESGLAVDLTGVDPRNANFVAARREWLDANAWRYGWKNTGRLFRSPEPWHWEYEGGGVA